MSQAAEHVDRRVLRSQKALKQAFVALVVERGYDRVSVEDITTRADVARATFYAHYAHKDDLLTAVFTELVDEVVGQLTARSGPWNVVRTHMLAEAYRHADTLRDLYRVCLSGAGNGRAHDAYVAAVVRSAEVNFRQRQQAIGEPSQIPIEVLARAFAGAHVTLLRAWLEGEFDCSAEEMARLELETLVRGLAWAQRLPIDLGLDERPVPLSSSERP